MAQMQAWPKQQKDAKERAPAEHLRADTVVEQLRFDSHEGRNALRSPPM